MSDLLKQDFTMLDVARDDQPDRGQTGMPLDKPKRSAYFSKRNAMRFQNKRCKLRARDATNESIFECQHITRRLSMHCRTKAQHQPTPKEIGALTFVRNTSEKLGHLATASSETICATCGISSTKPVSKEPQLITCTHHTKHQAQEHLVLPHWA